MLNVSACLLNSSWNLGPTATLVRISSRETGRTERKLDQLARSDSPFTCSLD